MISSESLPRNQRNQGDKEMSGLGTAGYTKSIEVGKVYNVNSQRKGKFTMRVTHVNDTFVTGVITDGKASAMMDCNEREQGEEVTVRHSLCSFTAAGVQA